MIFDPSSHKRGTRFTAPCDLCGRFTQIARATPVFLTSPSPVGSGFWRTDLVFGSAAEARQRRAVAQWPMVIVSSDLGQVLRDEMLSGLTLAPIRR